MISISGAISVYRSMSPPTAEDRHGAKPPAVSRATRRTGMEQPLVGRETAHSLLTWRLVLWRDRYLGLGDLAAAGSRRGRVVPGGRSSTATCGETRLLRRGVDVDILLAREAHERVHDLVGDRTQDEPVRLHALVAREVHGLTEHDADPHELGDPPTDRLGDVGSHHRDGDHGRTGLDREPSDPGLAPVEPAVGAAGPLGIDAEELALGEPRETGAQRSLARLAASAVHRDGPDAAHEARLDPTLET